MLIKLFILLNWYSNLKKMKKIIYTLLVCAIIISCNSVKNSDNLAATKSFEENSKTMQLLLESYANESVDYSKFSDDVVFKGTLLGAPDTLRLDQIKSIHKEFFAKYDVKHMAPFNFLQGVNPETGESDGSVRFYYDMQVTNSSNGKSVVIPIYESFDFDEDGKALYVQWYCDWTASIESLE